MTDLQQRLAEALAEKFTRAVPRYDRKTDTDWIDKPEPADRVGSAMTVSFIAGDGHPAFRMVTCNEAAQVCAEVVAADVARSARAAADCGKATASLIDLFHAALRAHREHGADAAVKVLLDHGDQVPEFLDGLDLPEPVPAVEPAPVSELLGAAPDWLDGRSVDDHVRDTRR